MFYYLYYVLWLSYFDENSFSMNYYNYFVKKKESRNNIPYRKLSLKCKQKHVLIKYWGLHIIKIKYTIMMSIL